MVGAAVPLEKMAGDADLIFKGTAISSQVVNDAAFRELPGYACYETQFKIVSVVKGEPLTGSLKFHHYDIHSDAKAFAYSPQSYHFEPGKSYLVFAKRNEAGGFQQIWMSHTGMVDEGVLRCADERPVESSASKRIIWSELTGLLRSKDADEIIYAIRHLDEFSSGGSGWEDGFSGLSALSEFSRVDVLAAVHGLISHPEANVARQAITTLGSHNPCMAEDSAQFWLATVGKVPQPGLAAWNAKMENIGGKLYRDELVALADGKADASIRGLAASALGLVRDPALREPILRWLDDPASEVRSAAVLLVADFPALATRERVDALANDPAKAVRVAVAHVIGFGQYDSLTPVLSKLLTDENADVRKAASMSLLSFSPQEPQIATVFRDNLKNAEFAPLFLLALARDQPGEYLDGLAEVVERQTQPGNGSNGQISAFTAWELLFKYLQARPAQTVVSGRYDRYLDAMEKVGNYSSSEPRDIYAFYVQRGMTERAKRYRQAANKAAAYDLDYYFKQVDASPSTYTRGR